MGFALSGRVGCMAGLVVKLLRPAKLDFCDRIDYIACQAPPSMEWLPFPSPGVE